MRIRLPHDRGGQGLRFHRLSAAVKAAFGLSDASYSTERSSFISEGDDNDDGKTGQRRYNRTWYVPGEFSGCEICRIAQPYKRDPLSRPGNRFGPIAGRSARNDTGARALLGER